MTAFEKHFVNREKKGMSNYARLQRALERVATGGVRDVLELGCGIGTVSSMLARETPWQVVGTDFDGAQVLAGRKHYGESESLRFRTEDASNLSFPEGSFDLVISQNVFHHIAAWRQAIEEIARVLRPSGYLVWYDLACPRLLKVLLRPVSGSYGVYTPQEILDTFQASGFKEIHCDRVKHGPVSHLDLVLRKDTGHQDQRRLGR